MYRICSRKSNGTTSSRSPFSDFCIISSTDFIICYSNTRLPNVARRLFLLLSVFWITFNNIKRTIFLICLAFYLINDRIFTEYLASFQQNTRKKYYFTLSINLSQIWTGFFNNPSGILGKIHIISRTVF